MKPLAIFRHAPGEGPGYLTEVLTRRAIPFTVIHVDRGEPLPAHPDAYAGLVFMGGPMSANDDLPWIPQTLGLIREAHAAGQAILGHCLGGQLISKALGGRVTRNPVREVGWGPIEALDNASARDWLSGLPRVFDVFHWHGETFSVPEGASHILKGPFCPHQGFAIGRTLALQCHIEMTSAMIAQWLASPEGRSLQAAPSVQTAPAIRERLDQRLATLHVHADRLYARWLEGACA